MPTNEEGKFDWSKLPVVGKSAAPDEEPQQKTSSSGFDWGKLPVVDNMATGESHSFSGQPSGDFDWGKLPIIGKMSNQEAKDVTGQSLIGKAWDWLWEPRYNQVLDFLGAPKSMQYTGELAQKVQQGVGGKTGAILGGLTSGVEGFVNSQSSIGALALLIGTAGMSGIFQTAGEAALIGAPRAAEAVEGAVEGAQAIKAEQAATEGSELLKRVFTREDVAQIQTGMQAVQKAEALGTNKFQALVDAGVDKNLFQEGLDLLHRVGLGPQHLMNRGLIVNGGGQLLRTLGMGIASSDKVAKAGQLLLDANFSIRAIMSAAYDYPNIWQKAMDGDTEGALAAAAESGLNAAFGVWGLHSIAKHGGTEVFNDQLAKYGFKANPKLELGKVREVIGGRNRDYTDANVRAGNFAEEQNKTWKDLTPADRYAAFVLVESGLHSDEVIKRNDFLARSANRPERIIKTEGPQEERFTTGLRQGETYEEAGDPQALPIKGENSVTALAQSIGQDLKMTPEDKQSIEDIQKHIGEQKDIPPVELYYDHNGKLIAVNGLHRAYAYATLANPIDKIMVVAKYPSSDTPETIASRTQKTSRYEELARNQSLATKGKYTPKELDELFEAYGRAAQPSPRVLEFAKQMQKEFSDELVRAHKEGVHIPAAQWYITHLWDLEHNKPNEAVNSLFEEMSQNDFKIGATMLQHRTFENAFEGQMLGYKLGVTDPIQLAANYKARIGEMIADRRALAAIQDKFLRTSDGMPYTLISGNGRVIEGPNGEPGTVLVDPNSIRDAAIKNTTVELLKKDGVLERLIREGKILKVNEVARQIEAVRHEQRIKKLITKQGGATYNDTLGDMSGSRMWAVSIYPEFTKILPHEPAVTDIKTYRDEHKNFLADPRIAVGYWKTNWDPKNPLPDALLKQSGIDPATLQKGQALYWQDLTVLTPNRELAELAGQKYNQQEIAQLNKKPVFVSTGGTGDFSPEIAKERGWAPPEERLNDLFWHNALLHPTLSGEVKQNLETGYTNRVNQQTTINRLNQLSAPPVPVSLAALPENMPPLDPTRIAGGEVSRPYPSYATAMGNSGNPWSRQSAVPEDSASPTNADRVLMVQFSTNLINPPGTTRSIEEQYYDSIYGGARHGFSRMTDFWEPPTWTTEISHLEPNADLYVPRDMNEAKAFLGKAGYKRVLFSALDVNKHLIHDLVKDYKGEVHVGGYVGGKEFAEHKNVIYHSSPEAYAKHNGIEYTKGADYRHYIGSSTIPRLELSKGCLFNCAFCVVPKKIEESPTAFIDQQVDALAKLKAPLIYLNDKTFGQAPNYKYLAEVNAKLKTSNPDFHGFVVQTTATQLNKMLATPEGVDWFKKSGIKYVELGIESYNDPILTATNKPMREAHADTAAANIRNILKQEKVTMIPNILIGLPGETEETYNRTLNWLKENNDIISHANIYNLALYQDSKLGQQLTTADPNDTNENVLEKGYHGTNGYAPPEVHRTFAGRLYGLAGQLLKRGYNPDLATPDGTVEGMDHITNAGDQRPGVFTDLLDTAAYKGAQILHAGATDIESFGKRMREELGESWLNDDVIGKLYKKSQDVWTAELGKSINDMRRRGAKPNYVTDQEWNLLSPASQVALREFMKPVTEENPDRAPKLKEIREVALGGEAAKDWYRHYTAGFRVLFPQEEEFNRFTGVLAALSPRKAVRTDLIQSINVWSDYKELLASKPDGIITPAEISVIGKQNGVMAPSIPNLIKALTDQSLSGAKVEPFRQNLSGNFWKTTLDTWMQVFSGQKPEGFKAPGSAGYEKYLGIQARLREVSHDLHWTPEQVQSAVWTFTKTLAELANGHPDAPFEELVKQMTPDMMVAHSADFVKLIAEDEEVQNALRRAGIDEGTVEAAKRAAAQANTPKPVEAPNPRVLGSVAKRLERFRAELEQNRLTHQEPPPLMGGHLTDATIVEPKKLMPAGWIATDGNVYAHSKTEEPKDLLKRFGVKTEQDALASGAVRYEMVNKSTVYLAANELNPKTRQLMWHALSGDLPGVPKDSLKFQPDVMIRIANPDTWLKMSKSDAMQMLHNGNPTSHDMLGRVGRGITDRAAIADGRLSGKRTPGTLFQTSGELTPEASLDLASIGAKLFWDNPQIDRNRWEHEMQEYAGSVVGPHLDQLYTQALHQALNTIKDSGERPQREDFEGFHMSQGPIEGDKLFGSWRGTSGVGSERTGFGEAPGVYAYRAGAEVEPALENRKYRSPVRGLQALASIDTNPVADLARRIALEEHLDPGPAKDLIEKSLKDAGYTGYFNSRDPGRVFLFGDIELAKGEAEPTHVNFEQKLVDAGWADKTQASFVTALMSSKADLLGMSLNDYIDKRFHSVVKGAEPDESALHQTEKRVLPSITSDAWLTKDGKVVYSGGDHAKSATMGGLTRGQPPAGDPVWAAIQNGNVRIVSNPTRLLFTVKDLDARTVDLLRDTVASSGRADQQITVDYGKGKYKSFYSPAEADKWLSGKRTEAEPPRQLSQEEQQAVQGMTEFLKDGRAVLTAMKSANFSTLVHELSHVFRRDLKGNDLTEVEKWLGVKDGAWERKHEEQWARASERYFWDGKAPTPKLEGIFSRFKEWMHNVYTNLLSLPRESQAEIPENIRTIMAKQFGDDSPNAEAKQSVTAQETALRPVVEKEGAKWVGMMETGKGDNLAIFSVPYGDGPGATVSLPASEVNPESVQKLVAEKLDEMAHGKPGRDPYENTPPAEPPSDEEQLLGQPKDKARYVWNAHMYRTVPHSAFRDWTFAAHAADGSKVLVNGELRVHPEVYDYLTRGLGIDDEGLKKNKLLGPALKIGSQAKHTLLSLSPFHIPQIGLRAIMSGVLPRTIKWDIEHDPKLAMLVENGMTIGHRFGIEEGNYQEGLVAGSKSWAISKIPLVRDYQSWVQKFTFEKLMPSLKVLVGKELYDRNLKNFQNPQYYEKYLTQHDDFKGLSPKKAAARAAAIETNERLGGLNYRDMGRAAGTQDFLRLATLAPDWLESEVRLVKRLLDPTGGKLLRRDMVYFTAGLWMTARALNMLYTHKMHNESPFGVVVPQDDGREHVVSIRSLPTDMMHMANDPANFFRGRQSPLARVATSYLSGRDAFGRLQTPWQQTVDIARNMLPIPVQAVANTALGGQRSPDLSTKEQAEKAAGLTVVPNRTEALTQAIKLGSEHTPTGPVDPQNLRAHQLMGEYEDQLRTGQIQPNDIRQMVEDGAIAPDDAKRVMRTFQETRNMDPDIADLYTRASRLGMPDFLKIWEVMNNREKAAMANLLTKKKNDYQKRIFKSMTPAQRAQDQTYQWIKTTFPQETPWWQ